MLVQPVREHSTSVLLIFNLSKHHAYKNDCIIIVSNSLFTIMVRGGNHCLLGDLVTEVK